MNISKIITGAFWLNLFLWNYKTYIILINSKTTNSSCTRYPTALVSITSTLQPFATNWKMHPGCKTRVQLFPSGSRKRQESVGKKHTHIESGSENFSRLAGTSFFVGSLFRLNFFRVIDKFLVLNLFSNLIFFSMFNFQEFI